MKMCYVFVPVLGLLVAIAGSTHASDYTYTTYEFPGAELTEVDAVSGDTVAGTYYINGGAPHGFIYNGSAFKTVDFPGGYQTWLTGISGGTVVGYSFFGATNNNAAYRGFAYNGSTFTMLNFPGSYQTYAQGVSGDTVVGYYLSTNGGNAHGFIYDGSAYTTLDFPGATSTQLLGVSGGTISGVYHVTADHPFTYDGSTFTILVNPAVHNDTITGISGDTVVGYYQPGAAIQFGGFVYDGSVTTILDFPGVWTTKLMGVAGNTVFGSGITYGFDNSGDLVAYGPGFVAQLQVPGLQVSLTSSNTVAVSWPYPSTGWTLQQNSDLTTTNWVTSTNTVANDGTNNFIIAASSLDKLFFRLKN